MTEKKRTSKTSKLKNFLVTGTIDEEDPEITEELLQEIPAECSEPRIDILPPEEEVVIEDIIEELYIEPAAEIPAYQEQAFADADSIASLEKEIAQLRDMVSALTSEIGKYTTSKEQLKEYSSILNKRDAELANRKFMVMLEQLSAMREDFFKLCNGMNAKLGSFSPKDILSSFEAYGVDMENILVDCGVEIGPSKFERLNTIHQRIVDVIPTDDESMNGMIAERVSDGYVYQGRVLQKEKVKIYRFSGRATEGDEEK
ncbi:MAG: nucleotide exchange factor GrpE [Candidatus Methanoplasma sp.]|jgi:molecular chaperone GrpE (heat shock protein)|nr:nucleotide exchange factor GrpE [Candidatus Methanoplasma sp.]